MPDLTRESPAAGPPAGGVEPQDADTPFRGLIDAAPTGILLADEDARITYVNARAAELFGWPANDLVGRPIDELVPSARRIAPTQRPNEPASDATGATITRDVSGRRRDGTEFPVEIGLSSFEAGGRRLLAASVVDITARKATEAALAQSERRFGTVLEAAPNAIVAVDVGGRIVYVNPRVEATFGYAPAELLGEPIETLLPSDRRASHVRHRAAYVEQSAARPMGIGLDLAGRRKDGSEFPVEISLSPVHTPDGLVVFATVADISGRKALEEQLLHAQKMDGIGRLAGGVAHDFNNVLTAISGYSQLLLSDLPRDSPHVSSVEAIRSAAERATALTQQLLAFSRRQVVQPRVVALNEVVEAVAPMLGRLVGERIELQLALDPRAGRIRADPTQIDQIVLNLVVNARDAMPDGGRITVATGNADFDESYTIEHFEVAAGRYVMLAVTDTGVGMNRDTRQHAFEPFFTTKPRGKGTGLGLATVYGIVRQAGGHIWLYSEPALGTTIKLYFPRVDARAERRRPPQRTGADGHGTILLVEDDEAVRQFTTYVLERRGYEVIAAPDAAAALASDAVETIDAVLTDVVMPGMSGPEMIRRLRERRPDLPVLFVSGYTEEPLDARDLSGRAVAFLGKPFSPDALVERLDQVMRAARHDDGRAEAARS